jgi:hypothetical protein
MWCAYCTWPYIGLRPMELGYSYSITCHNCGAVVKVTMVEMSGPTVSSEKLAELHGIGTERGPRTTTTGATGVAMVIRFHSDRDRQLLGALLQLALAEWTPRGMHDTGAPPKRDVDKLARMGWARCWPRPDERKYAASLTDEGKRMAKLVAAMMRLEADNG